MQHEPLSGQLCRIVALDRYVEPTEYLLVAEIYTIGRASTCDIVVQHGMEQSRVSRIHARIEGDGMRYVLHDNSSANGTFVNNHRIYGPHLLKHNDVIGFGSTSPILRFVDPDPTFVPFTQLRYDERLLQFFLNEKPLELPPVQFRLLHYLYQHAGEVCSREACAQILWGRDYEPGVDSDSLDRVVSNIRLALRAIDNEHGGTMIKTRRGIGYVLTL